MNKEQKEIWQRILEFELDDYKSSMTFTDRLARDNNWTLEFAYRAVFEYKRFMFLICADKLPKTPSDEVDQVWHMHLLYTHSYWKDFCPNVLKMEVHHGPTKGAEQRGEFKNYYEDTLKKYEQFFNEIPPADIWPSEKIRFSQIHFTRVNMDENWLVKKVGILKKRNK